MIEQFEQNGDTTILEPIEVAKEIVRLFKEQTIELYPDVYNEWINELEQNNAVVSDSLNAIIEYYNNLPGNLGITKKIIYFHYYFYKEAILNQMKVYFEKDMQRIKNEGVTYKRMTHLYMHREPKINKLRDIVSKNGFVQTNGNIHRQEILDEDGMVHTVAEVRKYNEKELFSPDKKANKIWMTFLDQTLNSLDELTADIFEMVCNFWRGQQKNNEGFIYFDSNDALALKYGKDINNAGFKIRERERFDIMKRCAALGNIFISERGEDIKIIDKGIKTDAEEYDFTDFTRMFEIQSVRMASSKRTHETKGIYGLYIKPGPVLEKYLMAHDYPLSALDIKTFSYNHYRQSHHKKAMRYLSNFWKMYGTEEIHLIKTLLEKIDFPSSLNGVQIRDRFENMLDDFLTDKIIKSWSYTKKIDETKIGKTGWFLNYWSQLCVRIVPSDEIVRENQLERKEVPKIIREPINNQLVFDLSDEIKNTREKVDEKSEVLLDSQEAVLEQIRKIIDKKQLSNRQTAQLIGISHVTFQRYLNNESKSNKKNFEKMKAWILEQCES